MTLKEKFEQSDILISRQKRVLSQVKIADEFAKEVLRVYIGNKTLQYKQSQGNYSLDELLLIIKKEKGL